MNRLFKILLGVLAAIVVVIVVAVVSLALFFNANDYRGPITAKVEQVTGRDFKIQSIHLSIFPTLGLKLQGAVLGNAKGFGSQPFAQIGEADVGVRILPLIFEQRLEVGTVYLSKLNLNLEKNKAGQSNWSDWPNQKAVATNQAKKRTVAKGSGGIGLSSFQVGSVSIEQATIKYTDASSGSSYELNNFNLSTNQLHNGKPFGFRCGFDVASAKPDIKAKLTANGTITLNLDAKKYAMQGFSLQVKASGKSIPAGAQNLNLSGDMSYDGSAGTARLADATLQAAGITAHLSLRVQGIGGKDMAFAGPLRIDSFSPRDTLDTLGISYRPGDPKALQKASLSAKLAGNTSLFQINDLRLLLDGSTATGNVSVANFSKPSITFGLKVDSLNVDNYMPVKTASSTNGVVPKGKSTTTRISTAPLTKLGLDGRFDIGHLIANKLKMDKVAFTIKGPPGATKVADLSADLYGGHINSTTHIGAGSAPSFSEVAQVRSVQAGPLLQDMMGKDYVTGTGNASLNLTADGNTVDALKRTLNGQVAFKFANGAVKGIDIAKILRQGQNLLTNQPQALNSLASGAPGSSEPKTDFSDMSVSGQIKNGILTSNDLHVASPLMRVGGDGTVNLVAMTVDYTVKPTLVNTATGQGGKSMSQLRGVMIPIHFSGPLSHPKYTLDVEAALKQQATKKLRGRINNEKKKLEDKLRNKLQDLFGGGG